MRTLSLIKEGHSLKAVLLCKDKNGLRIELVKTIPLSEDVKPLYILAPALENKPFTLSTALDSSEVLFRKLNLPIADQRKALEALPFQLEALLPYSPEETILAPILKKTGKHAMTATLFATRESLLAEHLADFAKLEIDPDIVTTTPLALFRLAKWLFPQENHCALFYWGPTKSFCLIVKDQEIVLTHTLHYGLDHFFHALSLDFPDLSEEELKLLAQHPNLSVANAPKLIQIQKELSQELRRLDAFLKNKQATHSETPWHLFGTDYPAFGLKCLFSETISSLFLSLKEISPLEETQLDAYALPIGLGLNALSDDDYSVQLREGKWAPKNLLRNRKRFFTFYAGACAALTCLISLFSHSMLHKKEQYLAKELSLRLPSSLAEGPLESEEHLRQKLWEWEKTLTTQKLTFPFLPNVATVSDLLAWISTHPTLNASNEEKKEKIDIRSIRYQLVKYPKLGETTDPYLARVDLEFNATSPRLAREFHDALLKGDAIVNSKKEIKWSAQNTSYFTSFELNPLKKGGV